VKHFVCFFLFIIEDPIVISYHNSAFSFRYLDINSRFPGSALEIYAPVPANTD
jgi:hypothetical protein